MSYISWLREQLREEINFKGPNVLSILYAMRVAAPRPEIKARVDAMAQAYLFLPDSLADPYILLNSQLCDNDDNDLRFRETSDRLNRRILVFLFIYFFSKRN